MTSNNFDIYNIINKADIKDRAIIYFDELLHMSLLNERKFNDTELDALSDSFKNNHDANLFNALLQRCMYSLLTISEAEKEIMKMESLATHLRFYFLTVDDRFLIETLISGTSKDLQKNKTASDKKQIKKAFKLISDRIEQLCFIAFGDSQVKKLVDKLYNTEKEEKDWDFYEERFVKFFTDHIAYKINNANEILKQLKSYYVDFEVKFEVIENKIGQLEKRIENFRTFESKVAKTT